MKKATLILLILLLPAVPALAVTIAFDPSDSIVDLADIFDIDIRISDLGTEVLSTFDVDLTYDDTVIAATAVTFGTELGGPLFSLQSFDVSIPGFVNVAELSLLSDGELALSQPDSFVFATITFQAVGLGTSPLVIDPTSILGGLNAARLDFDAADGSVTVRDDVAVPEPATWLLLGSGLIGGAVARKRR